MKSYKIFTSGKMGGLDFSEQISWRKELTDKVQAFCDKEVKFINPPQYFDYSSRDQTLAKKWEYEQIADSDIVVVNLNNIKDSIGTHMELGLIDGINRTREKKIYVVGIGEPNVDHPWIETSLFKQVQTIDEAVDFIISYLLV